jgi:quinol monooxygenase YgiN
MSKVILEGFIVVPESDLCAVQEELKNHIKFTLEEPGCIVFDVTQSESNPCHFDVYEEFKDKVSFEIHQARVKASCWGKVSVNVERHYKIME